ncbi:amidohydrolase [Anoxynatronum buryatiense]|uniref:Amidohydrolase 3 domain-containing protein n=1 Tax=Anoxynatronum buryatiense TaxID=489973 RepID=A0AA45WXY3_9CLOT|nr:amidohydrolase [Anoxynatronum buryatiense]SMP65820.1 hypothetical protein SAMN06296020_11337 [Anoxynatronum buryatiense]
MKADYLIWGKAIFDSIQPEPFAGFVAVQGNRILQVGTSRQEADALTGTATRILDAGDGLVMPAFFDSHTHLVLAGMYQQCVNLGEARTEADAAAMVQGYAASVPDQEWVIGFNWYHVFWEEPRLPTRHSLDQWLPHRPVILVNAEAHGAWVNTKALELAGITRDTPNPPYGTIHRDDAGEATGFLEEAALGLVGRLAFDLSPSQEKEYIRDYLKSAAGYGITAVKDMQPYFGRNLGNLQVYAQMEADGELPLRVHAAPDLLGDLDEAENWRRTYASERLQVRHLKQFMDGVSTTHTALMLEDYADGPPGDRGASLCDLEAIGHAIGEGHRRNFSICLHSCGDRSARLALDYIEAAVKLHGPRAVRHTIEHNELVDPTDIPRYRQLEVIPSFMPEHLAMTQTFAATPFRQVMGEERAARMFAMKSFQRETGLLAIGSDCPVVSNNPFLEIYRAVTRLHNDGEPTGGWTPSEKLTMAEVLRGYTYGSAYSAGREAALGTLAPGRLADMVILDQNLFDIDPEAIRRTRVTFTMMDGAIING